MSADPDHITALRAVLRDRVAEALAVVADTGDRYPNPQRTAAWLRVALAEDALNAALATDMRRRGEIILRKAAS